jgi:putative membrane protein insertion efficiency factor
MKIIKKIFITIYKLPLYASIGLIRIYQFFLSTDHSFWARPDLFRICTYQPSCSEFTRQAILKFGLIPGSILGLKRIIDCNPFSHGGFDPIPNRFTLTRYKGEKAQPNR